MSYEASSAMLVKICIKYYCIMVEFLNTYKRVCISNRKYVSRRDSVGKWKGKELILFSFLYICSDQWFILQLQKDDINALLNFPWASFQIRKVAGCACAGNAGNVSPRDRLQRKPLVSDPDMHNGTCVTHVPWCMSGSLTRGRGENVPGIPGACAPAILCIWQEAHVRNNVILIDCRTRIVMTPKLFCTIDLWFFRTVCTFTHFFCVCVYVNCIILGPNKLLN